MRYTLEIQKLLNQAEELAIHPKDKVKYYLKAIYLADENDDVEWAFDLRISLLDTEWGLADRQHFIPTFTWLLGAYDQNPDLFDAEELLWKYKWIIDEVYSNPDVSLEQTEDILADFKRRIEEHGYGLRAYYTKRLHEALDQKDIEKTQEYLALVNDIPRDHLSDCQACEMDTEVMTLLNGGNFHAGYEKAQPLLSKQYTCAHVPLVTHCNLTYHAIINKEEEIAAQQFKYAEEALAEREDESSLIRPIGQLIVYLFHTNKALAWQYVERYLPWNLESDRNRSFFFAKYMVEGLRLENESERITLQLPPEHPLYNDDNTYLIGDLYKYYHSIAINLGKQFDVRNGNSNFINQIVA